MPSRHLITAAFTAFSMALALAVVVPTAAADPISPTPKPTPRSSGTGWTSTTNEFATDLDNGTALPPSKDKAGVERAKATQDSRTATRRLLAGTPSTVAPSTLAPSTLAPSTETPSTLTSPNLTPPAETPPTLPPPAETPPTAEPLAPYRVSGVVQRPVPRGERPYEGAPLVRGLVDSTGVRMFRVTGDATQYNHPVGQAQLSMAYLDYYRLTGLPAYLRLAKVNAQRLVDRRVESRGGWFFPYDFDFSVHGDTSLTMKAPWYSGMAQGVALSAFTRLHQVTGDPAWKTAATAAFTSLNTAPVEGEPFGSWVSSTGDLWLELYPRWPVETSERVLNGHIFAAFGLYDYAQLTGSEDAQRLYDGALTTVERYLMSEFRTPRWASLYSLAHRLPTIGYHQKVVVQMLYLQHQTGNPIYTSWATTLRSDFPSRTVGGFAIITPRTRVIYQLNSARKVTRTRAVRFTRPTGAPVNHRERAYGGAIMLRVSAGAFAGWWFPEAFTLARIRGPVDVHPFKPALQATFAAGKSTAAYTYSDGNVLVGARTLTFSTSTQLPVTRSAIVDGRLAYYLPTTDTTGQWVGAQAGLTVG